VRRNVMTMLAFAFMFFPFFSCRSEGGAKDTEKAERTFARLRDHMVSAQIERRGVRDTRVLAAMRKVPRHRFVPEGSRSEAYEDYPLSIGRGQTISQPYIVGLMSELMNLTGTERVLEIGTGSGYQAAILAEITTTVYTMEVVPELAERAEKLLAGMGYENIHVRCGDGFAGWPDEAPFDAIMVTAAPNRIPQALVDQLKPDGRIVIPVGTGSQELIRGVKTDTGLDTENILPVRFVPMVGRENK
jgi:protein-L-isoaspartate(D-aspartate) O-methyltransferase